MASRLYWAACRFEVSCHSPELGWTWCLEQTHVVGCSPSSPRAPARKGYGIAYDLLGNRAEAEEAVQEALARACERDRRPSRSCRGTRVVPAHRDDDVPAHAAPARLRRRLFGWWPEGRERRPEAPPTPVPTTSPSACTAPAAPAPSEALVDHAGARRADRTPRRTVAAAAHRAGAALRPRPPVGEVAELLGVELATAKTHLVRGLAELRDLMEEHR